MVVVSVLCRVISLPPMSASMGSEKLSTRPTAASITVSMAAPVAMPNSRSFAMGVNTLWLYVVGVNSSVALIRLNSSVIASVMAGSISPKSAMAAIASTPMASNPSKYSATARMNSSSNMLPCISASRSDTKAMFSVVVAIVPPSVSSCAMIAATLFDTRPFKASMASVMSIIRPYEVRPACPMRCSPGPKMSPTPWPFPASSKPVHQPPR